jgi:hypothetical protein
LFARVHERTDRDYHFIDVPDEIPKFLTRPRRFGYVTEEARPNRARPPRPSQDRELSVDDLIELAAALGL